MQRVLTLHMTDSKTFPPPCVLNYIEKCIGWSIFLGIYKPANSVIQKGEMSETGYEFKRLQSFPHSQGRISLTELLKWWKKAATYTLHYQLALPKSVAPLLEQTQLGKN